MTEPDVSEGFGDAGVPASEGSPVDPPAKRSVGRFPGVLVATSVLLVATIAAAIVVALWPSGYLIDAPGNAIETGELVEIPKSVKTYSHPGGFRLVTVSETSKPLFGQAFVAWLDPQSDVFPRQEVLGDVPRADEIRYEAVLMQGAQYSAIYKAMRYAGLPVVMRGGGAFVNQIVPHSAADGVLSIGDTITSIGGQTVATDDDLTRFMSTAKVGERVPLVVDRLGVSPKLKLSVTLGSAKRNGKTVPQLGIYMETRPTYEFPFKVEFNTGDIGGPSAGLAMTLTLIDKLSPKGLTNGNDIAVTGTIQADGSVGEIGGVRQKVAAVQDAKSQYFLVPVGNMVDACAADGDPYSATIAKKINSGKLTSPPPCGDADHGLEILPVSSLDQALATVRGLPAGPGH